MSHPTDSKPIGTLISDALFHVAGLLRKEIDLARAEISEACGKAGVAIGLIVAGVVIVLTALNVLAAAMVTALVEAGMNGGLAALLVGGGLAILALILVFVGIGQLKSASLAPKRVVENVKKDAAAVKGAIEHDLQ